MGVLSYTVISVYIISRFVTVMYQNAMPPHRNADVCTPEQQRGRDGQPRSRDSRNTQVRFSNMSCNPTGHPTPQPQKSTLPINGDRSDYLGASLRGSASGRNPTPDPPARWPGPAGPPLLQLVAPLHQQHHIPTQKKIPIFFTRTRCHLMSWKMARPLLDHDRS